MSRQFVDRVAKGGLSYLWKQADVGLLIVTIVILTGILVSRSLQEWQRKRAKLIRLAAKLPGPPALPLIGNALEFACKSEELLNRVIDICQKYESPFRFWLGPKLCVVLTEPRDIEVILASPKATFKDPVYRMMEPFVGQGLVSGSGPTHRAHRRIIMPMLNGKVLDTYVEYFHVHANRCVELLEKKVDTGEFDVLPFMANCTADIMLETIMGTPGTAQQGGYKLLVHWTERMYQLVHTRMLKLWLHPEWLFSMTELANQQKAGERVIGGFTESLVERKRKEHRALARGSVLTKRPRLMILEQLLTHVEGKNVMSDKELRDEIYTLFTASQDTTAVISSFVFVMLAMHPTLQEKVRDELTEVIGEEGLEARHLPDLKYLEMVIRETLRLFPIAPLMVRQLKGDVDLETCTLPEGCSVVISTVAAHRSPKHWVDPDKFDPERFTPEACRERHPFAFIPFSGGLRSCIGQKFAVMCLKVIIAKVVRRYRLSTTSTLESFPLKSDISVRSINGYKISITKVQSVDVCETNK